MTVKKLGFRSRGSRHVFACDWMATDEPRAGILSLHFCADMCLG
jgi:hypothetical protein